jgi:hypothetical protein
MFSSKLLSAAVKMGAIGFALMMATAFCRAQEDLPDFTQSFDPSIGKIQVLPVKNSGLFHTSDNITLRTSDNSPVRVFGVDGTTVYQGTPATLPPLPVGHYFIECPSDRNQFLVLPDDYEGAPFLGTEADGGTDTQLSNLLSQIKPAYVRVLAAGGYWSEVQSSGPDSWDWSALDRTVRVNAGRKIVIMAYARPAWQTDDAQFISSYADYVGALTKRYRNSVFAIELWNEPWFEGQSYGRIPATNYPSFLSEHNALVAGGRQAVRSASSKVQLWGPAWNGDWSNYAGSSMRDFANAGGMSLIDTYSWHHYNPWDPPDSKSVYLRTDDRLDYVAQCTGTRTLAIDEVGLYGASALGIPAAGTNVTSSTGWRRGMLRAIKEMVMQIGGGVNVYIPHMFAMYSSVTGSDFIEELHGWECSAAQGYLGPRGPHPKTSATLMTAYWLNGASLLGRRVIADKVFLYAWQRPNGERVTFAWSLEDNPVKIQLDGNENVTDIFGHSVAVSQLSEEPVLFHDIGTVDVSNLLDGLQTKLTRSGVNRAPVLIPIEDQGVSEGFPVSFSLTGLDPDNDPLIYSADGLPAGASFNADTRRFSWTPTGAQLGTWPVTFTVSDGLVTTSQVVMINVYNSMPSGLTTYWKFDDGVGNIATDSAGNAAGELFDFNYNSSSGWVDTERGLALRFDGSNDYVAVDNALYQVIPSDNSAFSISLWLKADSLNTSSAKTIMRNDVYFVAGFRYAIYKSGQLYFWSSQDAGSIDLLSTNVLTTGSWYHAVVSYTGSSATMYINGSLVASDPTGTILSTNTPVTLGLDMGGTENFAGTLSDVMVFNRALNAQEVQALYQSTQPPPIRTNSAPVWSSAPVQVAQRNRTLTFTVSASDPDGDSVVYSAHDLPSGAMFDQTTQTLRWTPTVSQNGLYQLKFLASDGLLTSTQIVNVTVGRSVGGPVMKRLRPKSTRAGSPVRFKVAAKSPKKAPLTYLAMSLPTGAVFDSKLGQFLWTPDAGQAGTYSVTFVVTDGRFTDSQTILLTVAAH